MLQHLIKLAKRLLGNSPVVTPVGRVVVVPQAPIVTVSTVTYLPDEKVRPLPDYGAELVKLIEGCKLTAYQDIVGVWTIGYGATGQGIKEGLTWTQEQADARLAEDLRAFRLIVGKYAEKQDIILNHHQLSALTSFTYNLGRGCLVTLLANRTLEEVADAILLYHKAGGKPVRGLKVRRFVEKEIFQLPTASNNYNVQERLSHHQTTVQL